VGQHALAGCDEACREGLARGRIERRGPGSAARPREVALLALELVVILGVALLACQLLARRLRIATPVLTLACGLLLGLAPDLRSVQLPPEAVLLLFLPALLYWESLTVSLREIRSNLRVVVMMSTLLVIGTAAAVATAAHALDLPWGPAWVLGAAVAPTDATAVGIVARILPRRTLTVLRAESLINDGTALVIYGLAISATLGDTQPSALHVSWLFLLSFAGGAAAGLVTAWIGAHTRRFLEDPLLENLLNLLVPFTAFLLAELIHASGVLAVVTGGLAISQVGPRIFRADTRQQAQAFWSLTTFLLNGALFVLVGIAVTGAIRDLSTIARTRALLAVAVISAVVIGSRLAWSFTTPYVIRVLDRRPQQRLRRVGARARVVSSMAGFRGAVSLAAALAVPKVLDNGQPFPDRDVIVFVTSGVIVVTLVVQGLALPMIVRWARLPDDPGPDRELHLAQITATEEALNALQSVAARLEVDDDVVDRARIEYSEHLDELRAAADHPDGQPITHQGPTAYADLRLGLLAVKRAAVVRLRDERLIDDAVLRQVQWRLDIEERRLGEPEVVE
jgi:CPA1 family monovalent cation:H+ antiporter